MTTQEFFDKWNNKACDFDGYYGNQCVDLADQYSQDVVGVKLPLVDGAKDFWNLEEIVGYEKIANTPDGIPQKGDVMIWGTGVGLYGHIAIFDHGDTNSFTSFDQNWPVNSLCHYQNHNYNGVLGWFHPKSAIITQPITQPEQPISPINEIYLGILGVNASDDELKSRQAQLDSGIPLHDIVSQVLNEDSRSPLVSYKAQATDAYRQYNDELKKNQLLQQSNDTLTKKVLSLSSGANPSSIPVFTSSLGKLFFQLALTFK